MIKKLLPRFYSFFKNDYKIEDPRFANREAEQIGTKLVGWREKETNFALRTFKEKSAEESREAEERRKQIMAGRKQEYVFERTVPAEEEILGPSDSALKGEKKETSE